MSYSSCFVSGTAGLTNHPSGRAYRAPLNSGVRPKSMLSSVKFFGIALALALCTSAIAKATKLSSGDACTRLKIFVAHLNSAPHGPSEYRCELDASEGAARYYVFGLYSNYAAPPGASSDYVVWSSIVGWYAVSPLDGSVYLWDDPDIGLGKKLAEPSR